MSNVNMTPGQMVAMMPMPSSDITVLHHQLMYTMIRSMVDALVNDNQDACQQATGQMVDFVFNVFAGKVAAQGGEVILKEGYIALPRNKSEAEAMIKVGHMWLLANDPEVLKKKPIVSDLMRLAGSLRHATAENYDTAYKQLQNALYQVIPDQA